MRLATFKVSLFNLWHLKNFLYVINTEIASGYEAPYAWYMDPILIWYGSKMFHKYLLLGKGRE